MMNGVKIIQKFLWVLSGCLFLSGCYSSNGQVFLFNRYALYGSTPAQIQVEKGDTLYQIAKRYDVSLQDLISVNGLRPPYALKVGQYLKLPTTTQYYTVQRGDTLYSIARKYNMSVQTLAEKNNLRAPYALNVGQKIVLEGTATASTAKTTTKTTQTTTKQTTKTTTASAQTYTAPQKRTSKFMWPVQGKVISNFGVVGKGRKNDGINISAPKGTAVKAADQGLVAYAGNELKGFGNLILIKHPDGWITAYAHNDKLLVRKGQKVIKGEKIATVGSTGGVNSPQLHFEVRSGKKAVNPKNYLP